MRRVTADGEQAAISLARQAMRACVLLLVLSTSLCLADAAIAQDADPSPTGAPAPPPPPPAPFATTGAWSFTGLANVDALGDVAGGLHPGVKALSKFALAAAYDGSQDDHDGLSGLISTQFVKGGRLSARAIGDLQGADDIEATSALRLYEAWLSKDYDGARGWKVGLIDLNVDFDTQEIGSLFLNSSDGIGPELGHSGLNGPSIYPTTALGVTGFARSGPGLTLRAGVFDGTAGNPDHPGRFAIRLSGKDGVLAIGQVEQRFGSGLRLEGGAWAYSAYFDALDRVDAEGNPRRYQRSRGAYALIEAPLYELGGDDERGLSGWIRVGLADPLVQAVSGYLGGGVVFTGPIARRPQDQVGLAINHAIVEAKIDFGAALEKRAETAFELTYRFNATDWLAVQPDTQLIVHPAGTRPTALVIGVRFSVTLTKNLASKIKDVAP